LGFSWWLTQKHHLALGIPWKSRCDQELTRSPGPRFAVSRGSWVLRPKLWQRGTQVSGGLVCSQRINGDFNDL
jgi:hypothetical protein